MGDLVVNIFSSLRLACRGRYGHVLTNTIRAELEKEIMVTWIPGVEEDRRNTRRDGVMVQRDLRKALSARTWEHREVSSKDE